MTMPQTREEREAYYERLIATGMNPRFADMLAAQAAPRMRNSDMAFLGKSNDERYTHGLDDLSADRTLARAKAAGINTHGKVFMSQLGTPDNPLAWVSGIEDLRTSLRIQGKGCESMGIKPVVKDPGENIPLADEIIEEEITNRCMANPDLVAKLQEKPETYNELREQVIEDHAPRKR